MSTHLVIVKNKFEDIMSETMFVKVEDIKCPTCFLQWPKKEMPTLSNKLTMPLLNEVPYQAAAMALSDPGKDFPILIIHGELVSGKSSLIDHLLLSLEINDYEFFSSGRMEQILKTKILIIEDFSRICKDQLKIKALTKIIQEKIISRAQTIILISEKIYHLENLDLEMELLLMSGFFTSMDS